VAQAFAEANTVAWLLNKTRFDPEFRKSLRGADIYVDEASLLDNQTTLGLVALAMGIDARVIFQGDTITSSGCVTQQASNRNLPLC
jgi:hypothetical protein